MDTTSRPLLPQRRKLLRAGMQLSLLGLFGTGIARSLTSPETPLLESRPSGDFVVINGWVIPANYLR